MTTRRRFLQNGAAIGALAPFLTLQTAMAQSSIASSPQDALDRMSQAHEDLFNYPDMQMMGDEEIVMLAYPGMTMLDLVGPQYFLASMMGAKVHLVSKDKDLKPIMGDTGFAIVPTRAFDDAPTSPDVFFVPGGTVGTLNAMKDEETIDFIKQVGGAARNLTSVCTGSLILARAGLLAGKRATGHWAARDLLKEFGAIPVNQRVVKDGHIVTGAGVSAGLDFALALLAQLRGDNYAKAIQLQAEYAPAPMFDAGTPETSVDGMPEDMLNMFAGFRYETFALANSGL